MWLTEQLGYYNFVADTCLTPLPLEFELVSDSQMYFSAWDPVTGGAIVGSYEFDWTGKVTHYGFLSVTPVGFLQQSLFISVKLNGDYNAFVDNAAASYEMATTNPFFRDAVDYGLISGDGQLVANWWDLLPGSDVFDPYSTTVRIGPGDGGLFYYA